MQKLVWTNSDGESIDLTSGNYGITNWEGFSNTPLNIQSQQVPFQDGGVFLNALLEQRELSVTLAMQDNGNLEDRYRMRRELIHALNPKLGEGYLIYKNDFTSKRIKCIAQVPIFETHNSNDSGTPKATLVWNACDPYWEDLEETSIFLKTGVRKIIKNNGEVVSGVKIDFFTNNVVNPQIKNFTENKLIKLNGNFHASINIDTNSGQKTVTSEESTFSISNISTDLRSVTYSEHLGLFVAVGYLVGYYGTIITSSDGITWTNQNIETIEDLSSIIFSEHLGLFFAVGSSGAIITSSDGITWNIQTSGVSINLRSVTYSEHLGLFVAVGSSRTILTSSDGITWNIQNSGVPATLFSVTYSEHLGLFVAVGSGRTIITSSDGITWNIQNSGVEVPGALCSVTYSKNLNLFVAVGYKGIIITSSDGITWTNQTSGVSTNLISVTYSENLDLFVAIGYTIGSSRTIITSYDGITWNIQNTGVTEDLSSIIFSENLGLFVAVGYNGTIITSYDGITWNIQTSGVSTNLISVTYSKNLNLFVAVGEQGTILKSNFTVIENQISTLTSDSDMGFGLKIGKNEILISKSSGILSARIRFRQKYIGV